MLVATLKRLDVPDVANDPPTAAMVVSEAAVREAYEEAGVRVLCDVYICVYVCMCVI